MIINKADFPEKLQSEIGQEKVEFCVKTSQNPLKIPTIIFIVIVIPVLIFSLSRDFTSVFKFVGIDIFHPPTMPEKIDSNSLIDLFYYLFFKFSHIAPLFYIIFMVYKKYRKENGERIWVGTETKLLLYRNEIEQVCFWKDFNGNIEFKLGENTLTLELRKGFMPYKTEVDTESINKKSVTYAPERIVIYDVENIAEVAAICQKRIKQNDPTPSK